MNVTGGCLVVDFVENSSDQASREFQLEVFEESLRRETEGIIFNVSGVSLMDSVMGRSLVAICRTSLILGKKAIVVGLKPAVIVSLVDLEIDLSRISTARNIDEAIALIHPPQADRDRLEAGETTSDEDVALQEEDDENQDEEIQELEDGS